MAYTTIFTKIEKANKWSATDKDSSTNTQSYSHLTN